MIDKNALNEIAKLNGLKPWQQEKHYIQSLVLTVLAEQPLVFKGGTYLWFFHGLKRFSEDLDFTAVEKLPEDLPERVSKSLELLGIESQYKKISNDEKTFSFRISARGPLYAGPRSECIVYVEISQREPLLKKTIPLKFDVPAYQLPTKQLAGMGLEEVGAEKIRAILTREKARDAYDLWYLVKYKKIGFGQEMADKKLEYYGETFSQKKFAVEVEKKQKYYAKELQNMVFEELPSFVEVGKTIKKWAKLEAR